MQWNLIWQIIWISSMTILAVEAKPIQIIKSWIWKKRTGLIFEMLECSMCLGFWLGLIFTQDFQQAVVISIFAEFIHSKLKGGSI